ncbi:hypothetical protein, partial [Burkholderia vietnamiensis]|uniref:hypothetical protein n=1 Tax=Burkholderia vietnamiensis TaxID=60552 RepID=UPI002DD42390
AWPPIGGSAAQRAAGGFARACRAGNASNAAARAAGLCAPFVGTAGCPSRAASRRGAHFTAGTGTGRGMG